jgi:hypothetical protein
MGHFSKSDFVSNLNAGSIIDTWNFPAKTKMESNKRREGMYNIIDFQLMGGLSEHKNGGPDGSMSEVVGSNNSHKTITNTAWILARFCKL